jgi:hypothetical protein
MAESASVTTTDTVLSTPATVLAIYFRAGATAGSIVLRDGGAGGVEKLAIFTPASAGASGSLALAGGGIVFASNVHATLDQADGCTVIYQ